jgi:hypothetical protein
LYYQFGSQVLGNCIANSVFYVSCFPNTVAAFDLNVDTLLWTVGVPGAAQLDGMAADTSGHLYVIDMNQDRMHRITLSDRSVSVFLSSGLPAFTQDVNFDEVNNRLLVVGYEANSPLVVISLPDGTPSVLASSFGGHDGVTRDNDGNIYASGYTTGMIFAWNPDGSNMRIVSTGHQGGPAGIDYNRRDDILAVPCFNGDRVDFVNMTDNDEDGIPFVSDNCPHIYNPGQEDADYDGVGDVCDPCTDLDLDGYAEPGYPASTCALDNCPNLENPDQSDLDADNIGDECDNCWLAFNPGQEDRDKNGIGDACEGCCVGRVGNANGFGSYPNEVTISDIQLLVTAKFISSLPCEQNLHCLTEADVNQSGEANPACKDITISDIQTLVNHLFIAGPANAPLKSCL